MIIGLSKIYNQIYETLNNPESDLAEFAFCAYLLLPIIGARSFLIVLILFGVLYALDIIPNEKIVPNGNHAEDRSSFSIDESSDILSPALDFDFKIFYMILKFM